MYVGNYLHEDGNIGHEIINLYKADDGNNYIYLNSMGSLGRERANYENTVLLVRPAGKSLYKVLAKATGIHVLNEAIKDDSKKTHQKNHSFQEQFRVKYGGISLGDILRENKYHGDVQGVQECYMTFRAKSVLFTKEEIFITDNKELADSNIYYIRTEKGFGKQTLREFFNKETKPTSFIDLENLIKNKQLWKSKNTTKKIDEIKEEIKKNKEEKGFLHLIKKEYDELVFSNLISHFLKINKKMFITFAKDVLHIEADENFTLKREFKNIDILIQDSKNLIVIENKIKSDINGRHDIYGKIVSSQLSKYYEYTQKNKEYENLKKHYFIFVPNHNRINTKKFKFGDKYKIIYYDELYRFFDQNKNAYIQYKYFDELLIALKKHTHRYNNELEENMKLLFVNKIDEVRGEMLP